MKKVKCKLCNKAYYRITNSHLKTKHQMTTEQYKIQFPTALMESTELAMSRVNHLRGKTYEQLYGKEVAIKMKESKSVKGLQDWADNKIRIKIRELAEEKLQEKIKCPALIGRPRVPLNHKNKICKNCGVEFTYRVSDSKGLYCSHDCFVDAVRRDASDYRVKAFYHYKAECDECGETESKLIVHHRDRNRLNSDIDNLQILCNPCHSKKHYADRVSKGHISPYGIKRGFIEILKALQIDIADENFKDTPKRVANAYLEIFEGLQPYAKEELNNHLSITFPCLYDDMILVKDIICWSMCPHHFLPVKYSIDLAYIPTDKVLGISKLPRAAILLAKRPVLQEQLTNDIANFILKNTNPAGVAIRVTGQHLCMQMRGVKATGSDTVTSGMFGIFKEQPATRAEFMRLVR